MADQYLLDNLISDIRVIGADLVGDRTLYLTHYVKNGHSLMDEEESISALQTLWGYPVSLDSVDPQDQVAIEINKG
jgi:spore cortex formation protein SpoVR/YcgB (stage V sporulation)